MNKILDIAFPVTGGSLGAIVGGLALSPEHILHVAIDAAILAIVGGIVGYVVKYLMDKLLPKKQKRK